MKTINSALTKIITVMAVAAMLTGIVAGCGKVAEPVAAEESEAVETAAAEENEATEPAVAEEGEMSEPGFVEEEEVADYPSSFLEERCGRTSFDSYEEIISLLEPGEGYAYITVKGADDPILVIADEFFNDGKNGNNTLTAYPYILNQEGKYAFGSLFFAESTGAPVAVSSDGLVYCVAENAMDIECLGANGTDVPAVMAMEYVYVSYDDNGENPEYGGFIRTENTVVNNDGTELSGDAAKEAFEKAFADYETCEKIDFTIME
ncbi:MAG: hypothetical protein SO170_05990 [Butyribacter sp.]|nr:hypothetical protein [Butyribacter sp.]